MRSNQDLIQTYGSINQANVLRADNLNITDGTINITFTSVVNNSKISGIAVSRYTVPPNARSAVASHAPIVKTPKNATIYEGQAWMEFYTVRFYRETNQSWFIPIRELTLDLTPHNLSSGLYYLSVQNSQGKRVIKVGIKL